MNQKTGPGAGKSVIQQASQGALAGLELTHQGAQPLHQQLYLALRGRILAGQLVAGTRLPSSRLLAAELGVSRNTVITALDQLLAEGLVSARVGAGTVVSASFRSDWPTTSAKPPLRRVSATELSARGRRLAARHRSLPESTSGRPFQPGIPALDHFPWPLWSRLLARAQRELGPDAAGYGHAGGLKSLREAIAGYLAAARGVRCQPHQVLVVSNAQAALDITARMLTEPGDGAWLEAPGYSGARAAFDGAGLRLVPVEVDKEGAQIGDLNGSPPAHGADRGAVLKIGYVTPSHQFPLGSTLSLERRQRLLDWADRVDGWIIEDDYDSEFRYANRPVAAMQGLTANARVIYVGSFSKTMFPGLRVAYMVVPDGLDAPFRQALRQTGQEPSVPIQAALVRFITEGHFGRHLRRMRQLYGDRRHRLAAALSHLMKFAGHTVPADGGLQLTFELSDGWPEAHVLSVVRELGLGMEGLSHYHVDDLTRARHIPPGLVFGCGYCGVEPLEAHIERLASKMRSSHSKSYDVSAGMR
ncbi:MAG: PLP-dependent aminotransferase family protein [Pseudomonadota bacterium]